MPVLPQKFRKNHILSPIGWIYGIATGIRNFMFDCGLKKETAFSVPVINIGNITVGGTGKTPHSEYLIELLKDKHHIAVLSRGYKRRTKGFVLAQAGCNAETIGDEPFQIYCKYPDITVAVCENRVQGIYALMGCAHPDMIILDDAYQHRYVKPGLNIMLTDFNRFILFDSMLPAGRLRESKKGIRRADIVVVTKCPENVDTGAVTDMLRKYTSASILFSRFVYRNLEKFNGNALIGFDGVSDKDSILLVSGIANPSVLIDKLRKHTDNIQVIQYADHHRFSDKDLALIENRYQILKQNTVGKTYVFTTQKDAARLRSFNTLPSFAENLWVVPIKVDFIGENISDYLSKLDCQP